MNHNMICDPVHNVCDCQSGFELDNGRTPCKPAPPFDGKTHGRPCDDTQKGKHCFAEHNLECLQGICVCKDGYKPDTSTLRIKNIGVIVCIIGDGNLGHGSSCSALPKDVTQKCDTTKQLACEKNNLVCVCKPGYIPEHNKSGLCEPGVSKYNETCDPPEIIIRLPPVDPETGVVPPGPRSPPPPKIACNPDLFLQCLNSVCVCQDEGVSGRYRLDKKSGKCLVVSGYACHNDTECASGKCVELGSSEKNSGGFYGPHSHTHSSTVCSPLPGTVKIVTGGVKVIGIFRDFIFWTIFIIYYQQSG